MTDKLGVYPIPGPARSSPCSGTYGTAFALSSKRHCHLVLASSAVVVEVSSDILEQSVMLTVVLLGRPDPVLGSYSAVVEERFLALGHMVRR